MLLGVFLFLFLKWPTNTMVIQRFNASELVAFASTIAWESENLFLLKGVGLNFLYSDNWQLRAVVNGEQFISQVRYYLPTP